MKILITDDSCLAVDGDKPARVRGRWPCQGIACPGVGEPAFVTAYRRRFRQERDAVIRVHGCAGERYEFFVDGVRVRRGNERGDTHPCFFNTYELDLYRRATPSAIPHPTSFVIRHFSCVSPACGFDMNVWSY